MTAHLGRKRNCPRRAASTAVEFAFVAPVVLSLVFGIFEFSRVVMVQQAFTNAAREGCRTATLATTQNTTKAENILRNRLEGVVYAQNNPSIVRVEFNPASFTDIASGTSITTSIEIDYAEISLLPSWILGDLELRVEATMERE